MLARALLVALYPLRMYAELTEGIRAVRTFARQMEGWTD